LPALADDNPEFVYVLIFINPLGDISDGAGTAGISHSDRGTDPRSSPVNAIAESDAAGFLVQYEYGVTRACVPEA
jgi:hypothetical protein